MNSLGNNNVNNDNTVFSIEDIKNLKKVVFLLSKNGVLSDEDESFLNEQIPLLCDLDEKVKKFLEDHLENSIISERYEEYIKNCLAGYFDNILNFYKLGSMAHDKVFNHDGRRYLTDKDIDSFPMLKDLVSLADVENDKSWLELMNK